MNSIALNYLSLKYQKSTTSSSIDIGIRKFECVTKTQFLYWKYCSVWVDPHQF